MTTILLHSKNSIRFDCLCLVHCTIKSLKLEGELQLVHLQRLSNLLCRARCGVLEEVPKASSALTLQLDENEPDSAELGLDDEME
jgi:hypothetical protein